MSCFPRVFHVAALAEQDKTGLAHTIHHQAASYLKTQLDFQGYQTGSTRWFPGYEEHIGDLVLRVTPAQEFLESGNADVVLVSEAMRAVLDAIKSQQHPSKRHRLAIVYLEGIERGGLWGSDVPVGSNEGIFDALN